ncbi:MAG TPA: endonuclease VIII [Clostridia bacterium]|nr:endonuclease VIII [Clostridia bacterium]
MIEIPEALTLAEQINTTVAGKRITNVTAAGTPHKFAWYYGDPQKYHELLSGKRLTHANGVGSMVEIFAEDITVLLGEGVALRYHQEQDARPSKHQLLIEFEDSTALSGGVQMYGGLMCARTGELDNQYYRIALEKPSPLTDAFDSNYFSGLISAEGVQKLSIKAFLATEQRIPGLGNGVLQDILFRAGLHPKAKVGSLTDKDREKLYGSIRETLAEMTFKGGRDTEKDLFGCSGGYVTSLSKNTADKPCTVCGTTIKKENYLGGSIYYCAGCQRLPGK